MGISGLQRKQLQEALIDAFPDKASLEQMLSFELDKNLDEIIIAPSLKEIVFNLIKKASAENWVKDLISAARKSNPGNQILKDVVVIVENTPFYVPKLEGSPIFVKRIEEIKKIINILLDKQQGKTESVFALWAPNSYGKTTLVKMICYEYRIREYFTGGIFWNEIREDLDAKKALRKLYKNLTGYFEEEIEPYDLAQKWSNKPTLLVLDNIKTEEELALFLNSSGESCQWLIITQRLDILANRRDLQIIELSSFKKEELVAVLKSSFEIKFQIGDNENKKIEELADLLYDWPLLLNLASKEIQGLMNIPYSPKPTIVMDNIINNIKDWMRFDCENKISKIIEESLQYLTREEQEHFKNLFIFSADLDIPYCIIEKVWNLSDIKVNVDILCRKFYYLSLLKKYDISQQVIQLHDYLRRYFLSNSEIKKSLTTINKKFVEYYAKQFNLKSPDNLPDSFPLQEKIFLKRVYKHHWKLAQKF